MKLLPEEINERQKELPGWEVDQDALTREFKFNDFAQAFGFMASVAIVAEKSNHHPDWTNLYNRVTIRLTTHDAGGLTDLDFQVARSISRLFTSGSH